MTEFSEKAGAPKPSAAWTMLLAGLAGLRDFARPPRAARVQSWAAKWSSVAAAGRDSTERTVPLRGAQSEARRSHQGRFVRAFAPIPFGGQPLLRHAMD